MTSSADDLRAWDAVAESYAAEAERDRRFGPFLWSHLGDDLRGRRVLDVGCGDGWLAGACHRRGADVVGVDGSRALLARARAEWPDVELVEVDLVQPFTLDGVFDRVVANMVLMDVPDLTPLAASLRPLLAPDVTVVVTITHPAFFGQSPVEDAVTGERYRKVRGYLEHEVRWIETFGGHRHYHRPLGHYVEWLASLGLGVVELFEPPIPRRKPDDELTDYDRWFENVPAMLGMAAVPVPARH